jgi:dihydrofolate reductase
VWLLPSYQLLRGIFAFLLFFHRTHVSLDWLFDVDGEGDNGTSKFYDSVDTILIGRTTYDWIMAHETGDFQYKDKECYVFSRTKRENTEYVTFINNDVVQFARDLKRQDGNDVWIMGGGELLHSFMQAHLVEEIIVTIAPVLLGGGITLFKEKDFQTQLLLRNINRYNQFVELHYDVVVEKSIQEIKAKD